ncbi:hypothetical protein NHX12_022907 [Muraenolepis orangiensis]|uniref:1-acylglycerol-3-phosphate O-acyltransferase n=1 Tax=Muraenolepis orangiensis TaxID=630683 RepID=A0A9Q0ERZ5_9TELE|nr:hypothetical protein NHX12_022907 [Muraenolepis orangiensis]
MEVADKKGLPHLKHHLLPRTKGFWVTVQNLRGSVAAVYDSTLNFRNNETPTLLGLLRGKKYHADLYDGFQEQYIQMGRYPGPIVNVQRRPGPLLIWLCWWALVLYPLGVVLVSLLNSGSTVTILASVAICSAGQSPPFKSQARSVLAQPLPSV